MTQVRATNSSTTRKIRRTATPRAVMQSNSESERISDEQRLQMIREEAYFRAERRGFAEGNPEQDWLEAEADINRRLSDES